MAFQQDRADESLIETGLRGEKGTQGTVEPAPGEETWFCCRIETGFKVGIWDGKHHGASGPVGMSQ